MNMMMSEPPEEGDNSLSSRLFAIETLLSFLIAERAANSREARVTLEDICWQVETGHIAPSIDPLTAALLPEIHGHLRRVLDDVNRHLHSPLRPVPGSERKDM